MAPDRILIIDDNPINLKLIHVLLRSRGYLVRTAVNAEQALIEVRDFQPRMILMDIQLPDMDGLELTRILKADTAQRPMVILALTAYAMKGDEEKALLAGCDGYITKPIDTRALPELIATYLAGAPTGSAQ